MLLTGPIVGARSVLHFVLALVMFVWQLIYTFSDIGVLTPTTV